MLTLQFDCAASNVTHARHRQPRGGRARRPLADADVRPGRGDALWHVPKVGSCIWQKRRREGWYFNERTTPRRPWLRLCAMQIGAAPAARPPSPPCRRPRTAPGAPPAAPTRGITRPAAPSPRGRAPAACSITSAVSSDREPSAPPHSLHRYACTQWNVTAPRAQISEPGRDARKQ